MRQGRPKILRFGALLIAGVLSYSESLSSNGICHGNWAGDLLAWAMPLISFARHQYPPAIIRLTKNRVIDKKNVRTGVNRRSSYAAPWARPWLGFLPAALAL